MDGYFRIKWGELKMVAVWKKFTGSDDQLAEMRTAKHGWIVRQYEGTESFLRKGDVKDNYALCNITEYLICEPHPHAKMIDRWIKTGQPVYKFDGYDNEWQLTNPTWDPTIKYAFDRPKEKKKEFIEVRDYLGRKGSSAVFKFSLHRHNPYASYTPEQVEKWDGFIRWLDEDWRKIEI